MSNNMETWSHSPITDFKTLFFLDTNILCYLIDETYPSLSKFISTFKDSPFIELISSEYVLLEFVGLRKKEHYLREAINKSQANGIQINMLSLLNDYKRYSLKEFDFYQLIPSIKSNVDAEIEKIVSQFNISFSSQFHKNLFSPTSDLCLSTKISREDSLILISSITPRVGEINENVILLTNDTDFKKWYFETDINSIFQLHKLPKPDIHGVSSIDGEQILNLFDNILDDKINRNAIAYIKKILINRLPNLFIGTTFINSSKGFPNDCLCFNAQPNVKVTNNKYITILGKDLDFIYNIEQTVSFWSNGSAISDEGFIASEGCSYLSFRIDFESANPKKEDILRKLKEAGNMIFYHPDN